MPTEPRAVLWDMDGTLIDSSEYHWLTWQEALGREGYEVTREAFAASFGRRNDAVMRHFLGEDIAAEVIARVSAHKEERFRELIRTGGIEPLPGARHWLARLHAEGWRQAIASSAPRDNITAVLEALGIAPYFDAVAADDDVVRGKPDPQVFLVAAAKLGVPPVRSIVVEDAPAGVEGGRRGGMRTIGVGPNHATLPADLAVPSLDELPDDAFERLLDGDRVSDGAGAA